MKLLAVVLTAGLVASGWWLFDYGRDRAGFDSSLAERERTLLRSRVADLESENEQLRSQNSILQQASKIDRQAYTQVDSTLRDLQSEVLELKQEVDFYRGIVSPSEIQGLRVQEFSLVSNGVPGFYRYNLTLSQAAKNRRFISGVAKLVIVGMQGDRQQTLALSDVTQPAQSGIRFRFKYFQELKGDIRLPENFEPLRIELHADPEGRGNSIDQTFAWAELVS